MKFQDNISIKVILLGDTTTKIAGYYAVVATIWVSTLRKK